MNILVLYALMVIHWCLKGSHGDFMGCRGVCVEVSMGFIKFYWGFIEVHDLRGFLYRYSKYGILSNHIFIYHLQSTVIGSFCTNLATLRAPPCNVDA